MLTGKGCHSRRAYFVARLGPGHDTLIDKQLLRTFPEDEDEPPTDKLSLLTRFFDACPVELFASITSVDIYKDLDPEPDARGIDADYWYGEVQFMIQRKTMAPVFAILSVTTAACILAFRDYTRGSCGTVAQAAKALVDATNL